MSLANSHAHVEACFAKWRSQLPDGVRDLVALECKEQGKLYRVVTTATLKIRFDGKERDASTYLLHGYVKGKHETYSVPADVVAVATIGDPQPLRFIMGDRAWLSDTVIRRELCPPKDAPSLRSHGPAATSAGIPNPRKYNAIYDRDGDMRNVRKAEKAAPSVIAKPARIVTIVRDGETVETRRNGRIVK